MENIKELKQLIKDCTFTSALDLAISIQDACMFIFGRTLDNIKDIAYDFKLAHDQVEKILPEISEPEQSINILGQVTQLSYFTVKDNNGKTYRVICTEVEE
jgi:uncharacterized protein YaaN involved in tellurite resistance